MKLGFKALSAYDHVIITEHVESCHIPTVLKDVIFIERLSKLGKITPSRAGFPDFNAGNPAIFSVEKMLNFTHSLTLNLIEFLYIEL